MPTYGSKHAALEISEQGADPILHPATGSVTGFKKELVARFGLLGDEFIPRDDDGEPLFRDMYGRPQATITIRGNYWDSEADKAQYGWTDDEHDALVAKVEYFCRTQPKLVWRIEARKILAPWPTFDTQSDEQAVAFAIEGGLADVALAYARQEGRKKVAAELEAYVAEQQAEEEAAEALSVS